MRTPAVLEQLDGTEHRLLSFELVEPAGKVRRPTPPSDYLATIFDYTGNRAVLATGSLADPSAVTVEELGIQPLPSPEEFEAAVDVVREDPELGAAIRDERLQPYPAVPALIAEELPDGRLARTLAVGLLPREGEKGHEIVGVNLL